MPHPAVFAFGSPAAKAAVRAVAIEYLPAISSASLAAVLVRLAWKRCVPDWIREDVSFHKPAGSDSEADDLPEMERLSSVLEKLEASISAASATLQSPVPCLYASVLAYVQLSAQLKRIAPAVRDERYRSAGLAHSPETSGVPLKEIQETLDLAILAYYVENETFLRSNLDPSYEILHRSVATKPGSVSHFMAASCEEKVLLIGIKGTSSLEDLFTDTCGRSVSYHAHLDREEGSIARIEVRAKEDDQIASIEDESEIEIISGHEKIWIEHGGDDKDHHVRCHEGILSAAKRLALEVQSIIEKMVVNGDYKLVLIGHSLGGSAASLLAVILRARYHELPDTKLQVYAFAPPPVLDHDSAIAAAPYITSVVNNADLVPRSSVANLAVFLEFLRTLSERLEDRGLRPTGPRSAAAFLKHVRQGDRGESLMTLEEVSLALQTAHDKIELRHPDHLYIPGRVLLLYENWEASAQLDDSEGDGKENVEVSFQDDRRVYCVETDGTAAVLRLFEFDGYRMLGDHTTASYLASVGALAS
jgi:hypothetical protein